MTKITKLLVVLLINISNKNYIVPSLKSPCEGDEFHHIISTYHVLHFEGGYEGLGI